MNNKIRNLLISAAILPGMTLGISSLAAAATTKAPAPRVVRTRVVVYRIMPKRFMQRRCMRRAMLRRHHRRLNRHLTASQVKTVISARLIMRGNKYLTVGTVTPISYHGHSNFYTVNIVTKEGHALANKLVVNGRNGRAHRV